LNLLTIWKRIRLAVALALLAVAAVALSRSLRHLEEPDRAARSALPPGVGAAAEETAVAPTSVRLVEVASGLSRPLFVTEPPGGGGIFIVEQSGTIRVVRDGRLLPAPFLDLTADLDNSSGERGLLGLAFAPDYASSGQFYVAHTATGPAVVVRRWRVSSDPDRADPTSASLVLSMADPASNHNGGMIAFGPDGYLWVGTGDGGRGGDPWNNAQDLDSLLGKMLRLDVARPPYAIPADNPFADGRRGRPEIWASGLRNPWRFSFDRATGELWIADVGQYAWEEVNVEDPRRGGGLNYGWKTMEGRHCFSPRQGCEAAGLHLPIHEYGHDLGCSVTGGYVYRGQALPELAGSYLFSDYCSGRLWALRRGTAAVEVALLLATGRPVSSFGEDAAGEVYLCDHSGSVWRLESASTGAESAL
jgi:glucose/arabinose dehydrogenase